MLQKYDLERDESRYKFDLQRDEALRKFMAALWGVELKDDPAKLSSQKHEHKPMTRQDLMRNYVK